MTQSLELLRHVAGPEKRVPRMPNHSQLGEGGSTDRGWHLRWGTVLWDGAPHPRGLREPQVVRVRSEPGSFGRGQNAARPVWSEEGTARGLPSGNRCPSLQPPSRADEARRASRDPRGLEPWCPASVQPLEMPGPGSPPPTPHKGESI